MTAHVRMVARPIDVWPGQLTPDHQRQYHRFDANWTDTTHLLKREAAQLGAREIVLQLDIPERMLRNDGWIRADAKPGHPGVITSLDSKAGPLRFSTDRFKGTGAWNKNLPAWQANVRAIALGLEALRKVDRYGIGTGAEQYQGWRAIGSGTPMPAATMTLEDAARLLVDGAGWTGCDVDAYVAALDVEMLTGAAYRDAAKRHHPDAGGDPDMFRRLTEARDLLLQGAR